MLDTDIFIIDVKKQDAIKAAILESIEDLEILPTTYPDGSPRGMFTPFKIEDEFFYDNYMEEIMQFKEYLTSKGVEDNTITFKHIWGNYYPIDGNTRPHIHPDWQYYSIHILSQPEGSGELEISFDNETWQPAGVAEGQIIFFTGKLYHRVSTNSVEEPRISIGMQYNSIWPDLGAMEANITYRTI
jgi:hypothetical protein